MNRSEFPNGGWQFYQPQTDWWAPAPVSMTFEQQVVNIIKHRQANRAITDKLKLATDFNAVAEELEAYTIKRLGIVAPKISPPPAMPQLTGGADVAVAAVRKLATGAAILFEWEESKLPPVASELSAKRAAICADCPKNDAGGLTKYFTQPIADRIRARLGRLYAMNLTTPSDDKLKICSACLCPLPLKVHSPLELILKRMKPEQAAELDSRCWILKRDS